MGTYLSQKQKDERVGPFEDAEIRASLASGKYSPDDLAWRDGMLEWVPVHTLFPTAIAQPPPLPVKPEIGDDLGMRMLLPVGRSGWAIAAGYLGLFSIIILPAPIAIIVSLIAIRDIRKSKDSPHPKHGMGRAIFGLVMGLIGTCVIPVSALVGSMGGRH